jgi:hypothetical protein
MKHVSLNGVNCKPLPAIEKVLRKWKGLVSQLGSEWAGEANGSERDCPWWYLERTSLAFFAGAVWQHGGHAIEEYATDKKSRIRLRSKVKKHSGRGDLMFCLKDRRRWYVVEAKQEYLPLSLPYKEFAGRVGRQLSEARKDAVCCPSYGYPRLGMVFLSPYQAKDKPTTKTLREWVSNLCRFQKSTDSCVAWVFPSNARSLKFTEKKHRERTTYFYPGAALVIRKPRA